jgi:nitronate monooxygenase
MGGVATPELAAAVSNAGGLGVLGAAILTPDETAEWIERTRKLTSKPFGVDPAIPTVETGTTSLSPGWLTFRAVNGSVL